MNINRYKKKKKCAMCTLASALVMKNKNVFCLLCLFLENEK